MRRIMPPTEIVHREERDIKEDKGEDEMHLPSLSSSMRPNILGNQQ